MKYFIFRWKCCEAFKDSLLVRPLITSVCYHPTYPRIKALSFGKDFSFFVLFSEILILVIFIVQPGILLNAVKNVGLRIAAMHGQHRLVLLLGPPVSVRIGKSAKLVRFIGKPRL